MRFTIIVAIFLTIFIMPSTVLAEELAWEQTALENAEYSITWIAEKNKDIPEGELNIISVCKICDGNDNCEVLEVGASVESIERECEYVLFGMLDILLVPDHKEVTCAVDVCIFSENKGGDVEVVWCAAQELIGEMDFHAWLTYASDLSGVRVLVEDAWACYPGYDEEGLNIWVCKGKPLLYRPYVFVE